MMNEFVKHIAASTGLSAKKARSALGIVLNAAERQGAEIASKIYQELPGARTLSARMGAEVGASTGVIARLIEQTPGGRAVVAEEMIRSLQKEGLGHAEISGLFPAIGEFVEHQYGIQGAGHLGDVFGRGGAQTAVRSVA